MSDNESNESRETVAEIERHYNRAKERHPYFCDIIKDDELLDGKVVESEEGDK